MWPDSACDVAEIDPLVLEASHAVLGLERDTTIRTYLMDARIAVDALPEGRMYDLILGDVFTDLSIPYHLTTAEFQQKLARRLKPDGVLLHNVIDDFGKGGYLLGAFMLTLKKAFRHVYVFSSNRHGVSKDRDTFVVAAFNSDDPAIHGAILRYRAGHALELDGCLLNEAELSRLAWRCQYRILTDDHAPVENLIEPVVRARGRT
jgi:spermidine synthase